MAEITYDGYNASEPTDFRREEVANKLGARIEWLSRVLDYENKTTFSKKIQMNYNSFINLLNENDNPATTYRNLKKIGLAFPNVDMNWLFYGTGNPLIDPREMEYKRELYGLREEWEKLKSQIIEKDRTNSVLIQSVSKMTDMLEKRDKEIDDLKKKE